MLAVKIECGCGQRYIFDVLPLEGRMPCPVACPRCGFDGTTAANVKIAGLLAEQASSPAPPAPAFQLHRTAPAAPAEPAFPMAAPPKAPSAGGWMPGKVDPTQAVHEARSKILWGDPAEEALKYLRLRGFAPEVAEQMVEEMLRERAGVVRVNGVKLVGIGVLMMGVPVASYFIFLSVFGLLPIKLFAIPVAVGIWGGWKAMNGTFMLVAPRWQTGDIAEQ